jgi:hypothetical protein
LKKGVVPSSSSSSSSSSSFCERERRRIRVRQSNAANVKAKHYSRELTSVPPSLSRGLRGGKSGEAGAPSPSRRCWEDSAR